MFTKPGKTSCLPKNGYGVDNFSALGYRSGVDEETELVWSSDGGDLRKHQAKGAPAAASGRSTGNRPGRQTRVGPGTRMKVRREVAGRRGKAVTTVTDIGLPEPELKALAKRLKKRCGVGGTAKQGRIELQGDHRDVVLKELEAAGHDAVAAGG